MGRCPREATAPTEGGADKTPTRTEETTDREAARATHERPRWGQAPQWPENKPKPELHTFRGMDERINEQLEANIDAMMAT